MIDKCLFSHFVYYFSLDFTLCLQYYCVPNSFACKIAKRWKKGAIMIHRNQPWNVSEVELRKWKKIVYIIYFRNSTINLNFLLSWFLYIVSKFRGTRAHEFEVSTNRKKNHGRISITVHLKYNIQYKVWMVCIASILFVGLIPLRKLTDLCRLKPILLLQKRIFTSSIGHFRDLWSSSSY